MDNLFHGCLRNAEGFKTTFSLTNKEKERGRRKDIEAKLIVNVGKEILASLNFIMKGAKERSYVLGRNVRKKVFQSSCDIHQAVSAFGKCLISKNQNFLLVNIATEYNNLMQDAEKTASVKFENLKLSYCFQKNTEQPPVVFSHTFIFVSLYSLIMHVGIRFQSFK